MPYYNGLNKQKSRGLDNHWPNLTRIAESLGKMMNEDFDLSSSWVTCWRECNLINFKCKHCIKHDHYSEVPEKWIVSLWLKIQKWLRNLQL